MEPGGNAGIGNPRMLLTATIEGTPMMHFSVALQLMQVSLQEESGYRNQLP
jgi:hypothetical protein